MRSNLLRYMPQPDRETARQTEKCQTVELKLTTIQIIFEIQCCVPFGNVEYHKTASIRQKTELLLIRT